MKLNLNDEHRRYDNILRKINGVIKLIVRRFRMSINQFGKVNCIYQIRTRLSKDGDLIKYIIALESMHLNTTSIKLIS